MSPVTFVTLPLAPLNLPVPLVNLPEVLMSWVPLRDDFHVSFSVPPLSLYVSFVIGGVTTETTLPLKNFGLPLTSPGAFAQPALQSTPLSGKMVQLTLY